MGALSLYGMVLGVSNAARAQTVLIEPAIDPDFNRGRNISVTERAHPDYDALGIRVGSFVVRPAVSIASVATSNVYLDDSNKKSDVYLALLPILTVDSDWSNHRLGIVAAGDIRRYVSQNLRNQNAWYLYSHGQLDVRRDANLQVDAQLDKSYESPYSEDIAANLTIPSTYFRKSLALKGTLTPDRSRFVATADVNSYAFSTLRFANGASRDQHYRDRTVYRFASTYDYGLTPSISVFGQATLDVTSYLTRLPSGQPNRDSTAYSFSVGTNFDLAGLARGSLGIGYSQRHYNAVQFFPPAHGLSAQAKVEFFPTELTTVQLLAQRQIQDASLGNSGAFFNNLVALTVDHELLVNLIVSANAQVVRRQYLETRQRTDVYQIQAGARYQASRRLGFNGQVSYGLSRPDGLGLGNPFHEMRATLGVRLRD